MARILLAALLAFGGSAIAFKNTVPLVAWSTEPSCQLSDLQTESAVTDWNKALQILSASDICSHEGIILIQQRGLHASDLSLLPSSSQLSRRVRSSTSLFQAPRLKLSADLSFDALVANITQKCGHVLVDEWDSLHLGSLRPDTKYLFKMELPTIRGASADRRTKMQECESLLSDRLESLASLFPARLVLLAGGPAPPLSFSRRDVEDVNTHPPAPFYDTMQIPSNQPQGASFLSQYQILTPGLVSALLVAFVIFLPLVMVGVGAVASIQSPMRMEGPKGVSQEKKHQ
ncbi:hypothetical protein DACRYDRAFT_102962 [Dacryopinax primogenitus]|uniref:Protein BIG1 n=1 Tax=Dacryopinax primogenitus (strain DJM 731) TaxID=1858805 RepID=M5GC09_DACPD|nr:uncharacterized protein DACRYDRAFT_102962 [Dacryopinax primogenitus]EJU06005.1 hypothetical protein DACRYDRAFT_102962 [Dacryopinax primogenitus]